MALAVTFVGEWAPPLRDTAERVLAALQQVVEDKLPAGTINLKLVDDAEMLQLNKQYSGIAEPTDVLTFHYAESLGVAGESLPADAELADIAISTETAERQAAAAGTQLPDEIGLLVAHGLLHAVGYDHQTAAERDRVAALQRRIVTEASLTYREFSWKD